MTILKKFLFLVYLLVSVSAFSQKKQLETIIVLPHTEVKDQGSTGTCWCFSILSILESELLKKGIEHPDLSELFVVRNVYIEKAKNYILRQGFTRFSEGAFGHDVFPAIEKYGIVPQEVYPNSDNNSKMNHTGFDIELKSFLDSVLQIIPISPAWQNAFVKKLDEKFGVPPEKFIYQGKEYTPITFAREVLQFSSDDFIGLTSFTHHPFYKPFNVEVPDNYSGGLFYNLPITELIETVEYAISNCYTVGWDADVSNKFFNQKVGLAMIPKNTPEITAITDVDEEEIAYTQESRQELFENLTTQDDHLMHIVGLKKSPKGKLFFYIKNSWGPLGPLAGFLNVSETYFGVNTITVVLPVNGIPQNIRTKLGLTR
ncbi:MAG: C1 family peptidase [Ignavibacteria bacterium]